MRSSGLIFIAGLVFILLIDLALFIQIKQYLHRKRNMILYGLHSLLFVALLTIYHLTVPGLKGPEAYFWIGTMLGTIFLFYAPKVNFILFHAVGWLTGIFSKRSKRFFYVLAPIIAGFVFLTILCGITFGRYNYKTETTEIEFTNLPKAFDHFKIVVLADLHLGSSGNNYKGISKLVNEVNELKPDVILFVGDMVNNFAVEMDPWIGTLSKLSAKYGKFAVTGNHDYGDYTKWDTPEEQDANLSQFFTNMQKAGFHMLNNENVPLSINGDTIYIAGVENWGNPPFPRYGKITQAIENLTNKFVILLSHNPSHWRAEVLNYDIPLMLAGHTHAMQMGIKIGKKEWSPAQYIYPEYDGLYHSGNQKLYVSRGQGYIGFPGRIGLRPEISELILIRK